MLPARAWFEKSGHAYDLTGSAHAVFAGHAPPEGTLSDGEILVALASELGIEVPAPDELQALAAGPAPPSAQAFADPAIVGADPPAPAPAPSGTLRLALAAHAFAGGGTVWFDDRLGELRPVPSATFAPETAAAAGVAAGDLVDLAIGTDVLRDLVAVVDASAAPDTVVAIDGLPEAPANAFADGDGVTITNLRSGRVLAAGAAS